LLHPSHLYPFPTSDPIAGFCGLPLNQNRAPLDHLLNLRPAFVWKLFAQESI